MALLLVGEAMVAMASSLALTWMVRKLARRLGWVNGPISRRHVHTVPVPRIGGVAVFIAIAGISLLFFHWELSAALLPGTLLPAAWMFLVGLIDDVFGVRAHWKLAGQIVGGLAIFALGLRIPVPEFLDLAGTALFFSLLLTVGWTVVVMNAINLIDGLDGLACGSSACIMAAIVVFAMLAGDFETASFAAISIGVILGFLNFNAYPASIFLGDSGSLVLGAVIASLTVRLLSEASIAWLVCPLVLAHPLGEILISSVRRFLRADPIFRPDRRHLHHRLLDRGMSHAHASGVLVLASFLATLLGVLAAFGGYVALSAVVLGAAAAVLSIVELRYGEFAHFLRWVRKTPRQRHTIGTQMKVEELREAVKAARSLTELRIILSEGFVVMGFESARLRVRSYDSGVLPTQNSSRSIQMSFPLRGPNEKLGTLDLCWSMQAGRWPFDPEYFASSFLAALSTKLERFVHLYRELPSQSRVRSVLVPEILSSIAAESNTRVRVPLNS